MIQKVLKVGSSAAVTIPKKALKELGLRIGADVAVDVDVKRQTVVVSRPTHLSSEDRQVAELTANFMRRYAKDLRALAKR